MNMTILKTPHIFAYLVTEVFFSVITFMAGDYQAALGLGMSALLMVFTFGYLEKFQTAREYFLLSLLWGICAWFLWHGVYVGLSLFIILATGCTVVCLLCSVSKFFNLGLVK